VNSMISDHFPICLQLEMGDERIVYPFKYNHHWMDYPDFQPLVRTFWAMDHGLSLWSPMDRLVEKLRLLKGTVKRWSREKKIQRDEGLCTLELVMNEVFSDNPTGIYSEKEKDRLTDLEARKQTLLRLEEEEWRLKSRAIWVKSGDSNTAFFHKFANHRRVTNVVWDIVNYEGVTVSSQRDLA